MHAIIFGGLALEIYFKSLYYLIHGKDFKVDGRMSHDFLALFDSLDDGTQKRLSSYFSSALMERDFFQREHNRRSIGETPSLNLRENIRVWSPVFVKWRYTHEAAWADGSAKSLLFIQSMEAAIRSEMISRDAAFAIYPFSSRETFPSQPEVQRHELHQHNRRIKWSTKKI